MARRVPPIIDQTLRLSVGCNVANLRTGEGMETHPGTL